MDILHEKRTFSEEHFRQSGMSCDPVQIPKYSLMPTKKQAGQVKSIACFVM